MHTLQVEDIKFLRAADKKNMLIYATLDDDISPYGQQLLDVKQVEETWFDLYIFRIPYTGQAQMVPF